MLHLDRMLQLLSYLMDKIISALKDGMRQKVPNMIGSIMH